MPYVYIMSNRSKTFYTGTCRELRKRVWEHKNHWHQGSFTDRYRCDRLICFERYTSMLSAIAREKQIKGLTRIKKMKLIVAMNPEWRDLSDGWYDRHEFEPDKPHQRKPTFQKKPQT